MSSFGISNAHKILRFYLEAIGEVCENTDVDQNFDLSFDEWRDTQAIVAAGFSLVILEAFDADENGLIDSDVR